MAAQQQGGDGDGGEVGRLRAALLQQQAQAAALDLQVKVLSMQLLRSHAAHMQAGSSTCQLLSVVEGRLLALKTHTGRLMA